MKKAHPLGAEYRISRNVFDLIRSMTPKHISRFWSYVDIRDAEECWQWKRYCHLTGYGMFSIGDNRVGAHRIAAFIGNGAPASDSFHTLHRCDNRACCNPNHLFYGTNRDNQIDAASKGRTCGQRYPELVRGTRNGRAKLNEEKVRAIRASGRSGKEEAAAYGVTHQLIHQIRKGMVWKHI